MEEKLLTVEEYAALPDDGTLTELVRGKVVVLPFPTPAQGYYAANVGGAVQEYVRPRELGRVVSNHCGVVTRRGPDTVRGPDVAFYSYAKVPKGPLPQGYWPTPELVVEVRSPLNRWGDVGVKAAEYLIAGVLVVCVLDPETKSVGVYPQNEFPRRLTADEELTLPEVFPDFRVPVRQLFE